MFCLAFNPLAFFKRTVYRTDEEKETFSDRSIT